MTTPDTTVTAAPACTHPHGDSRRYRAARCHAACKCTRCTAANTRESVARKRLREAGTPSWVPAVPVIEQLRAWREQGIGFVEVQAATGVPAQTLKRIASGKQTHVQSITAETILAGRPDPRIVDAIRTRRQLRALAVAGFPFDFVADECRTERSYVAKIAVGKVGRRTVVTVTVDFADRVNACYEKWYAEDGPSGQARSRARRKGWLPAEAWTDATIGDPGARPWGHLTPINSHEYVDWARVWQICSGYRRYSAEETTIAEREEAVARLHSWGRNDSEIAKITDWSERNIVRIRQRLGLPAIEQFTVYDRPRPQGEAAA